MEGAPLRVLLVGDDPALEALVREAGAATAGEIRWAEEAPPQGGIDAVLQCSATAAPRAPAAGDRLALPTVVCAAGASRADLADWLRAGADDVLDAAACSPGRLASALLAASLRRRRSLP